MQNVIDQLSDRNLSKLSNMLESFLPREIMASSIDPIESILPGLMREGSPAHMVIMSMAPKKDVKVFDLPGGGKMIMKSMRSGHASFMENEPEVGMRKLLENKGECAFGDKFPVSDPLQAMLSLIYAHGQKDELPPKAVEEIIEPRVAEVAGSKLVEDIKNFIESVGKGTKEFMDTEEGKKVIVSIEDFNNAAEDIEKGENKEASWMALDNPFRVNEVKKHLKESKQVQTSLPKLAFILEAYNNTGYEIPGFINSIKHSIVNDGYLTINDKYAQEKLLEKLSDILKDKGVEDNQMIEDLIYNTDIPSAEGEIIQVGGYPIDVEKLNNLTYDEAKKALTESIANIIFNEERTAVDIDKFKDFIEGLLANQESDSQREEVEDRIVDPILTVFEKDATIGINLEIKEKEDGGSDIKEVDTKEEAMEDKKEEKKEEPKKVETEKNNKVMDVKPKNLMDETHADIEDNLANPKLAEIGETLIETFSADLSLLKRAGIDNSDLV